MAVYKETVKMETLAGKPTYVDVTASVAAAVENSGIKEGVVTVISCHTTCAVFSEEFDHDYTPAGDTYLQADLNAGLERVFPSSMTGTPTAIPACATSRKSSPGPTWTHGFRAATAPCCGTATRTCARR